MVPSHKLLDFGPRTRLRTQCLLKYLCDFLSVWACACVRCNPPASNGQDGRYLPNLLQAKQSKCNPEEL